MFLHCLRFIAILALLIGGLSAATAQEEAPQPNTGSEFERAFDAALKAATHGPADVPLRELATIHLPDSYSFIPVTEGAAFMRALGNTTGDNFHGLIIPKQHDKFWFVEITYNDSGHIKDDDARSWNADELLQSIKDATAASNKERAELGYPALDVDGWVEKPAYDASTHRLVWSILAKQHGNEAQGATINYNTYALGREGYFELNLVTGEAYIAENKKHAGTILAALDYKPGQRYTDFNSATDRVAEYGLAALIGGFAAKKLGLLAVIGIALAKFWKIILIGLAVFGGGVFKLFRRKNTTTET